MTTMKSVAALAVAVLLGAAPAMAQYLPQSGGPPVWGPSGPYLPQSGVPQYTPPIVQPPMPVWRPPVGGVQPMIVYPGSGQTFGIRPN